MWHKLLSELSLLWSKFWPPLLSAGLVAGLTYLLKRRDEKRDLRKRLSAELYIPARQQLSEAEPAIRKFQRALSINIEMWKKVCATGVADKLKRPLRQQLGMLYENTLPSYDQSWKGPNEELSRVREDWDTRYSDIQNYAQAAKEHKIVEIDWWQFLVGDAPVTPVEGLRDGDVLRLFNGFMTPARFKLLDFSVEQFLIKRWEEASVNPVMRHYRDCRQRALAEIPRVIEILGRESLI